jgi:hypothetical protein
MIELSISLTASKKNSKSSESSSTAKMIILTSWVPKSTIKIHFTLRIQEKENDRALQAYTTLCR